jgi:GH25 family lysozyme M1 (1,4-beta-N-acetylmuramidase)
VIVDSENDAEETDPEMIYFEGSEELIANLKREKTFEGRTRKQKEISDRLLRGLDEKEDSHRFGVMDKVLLSMGVVLLAVVVTVAVTFFDRQSYQRELNAFLSVGKPIQNMEGIGEEGIAAIETARKSAMNTASQETVEPTPLDPSDTSGDEYDEIEYSRQVNVFLSMVSIQKDLKVKFVDQNTAKLILNVPFQITLEDPDGKSISWEDDDMDGIIYKKNITAGTYVVRLMPLTGENYTNYILPGEKVTVEVKKDLTYEKVDVSDEVKEESEINVAKEDTEQKEIPVESVLNDTVPWVESAVLTDTYVEIPKTDILNPTLMASARSDVRLAGVSLAPGMELRPLTILGLGLLSISGSDVIIGDGSSSVSGSDTGSEKVPTIQVSPQSLVAVVGAQVFATVSCVDFPEGATLAFSLESDRPDVATAVIENNGKITVSAWKAGEAQFKVTVTDQVALTAQTTFTIKVTDKKTIALDYTALTAFVNIPTTLRAQVTNAVAEQILIEAVSSDTTIVKVSVQGNVITLEPLKEGNATVTVRYTENEETVQAICTITVKPNPETDQTTLLRDKAGNQLYVVVDNVYREAKNADYFTATKFYIRKATSYTGWQTLDGNVYFFTADGNKVTGEQVIQGAKYQFASDGSLIMGTGTTGIDVSKWNGKIDWNAVKNSGISYVIIRCGYRGSSAGALIEDPRFRDNIKGAIAAGLKVGVYFFTQAIDESEAVMEASMVLDMIKNYKISYPVFLDVEASGGRADSLSKEQRTAVCRAFCETIQAGGYTSGIYANKTWLETKLDVNALSGYKIWLAQYASTPTYTGRYDMWQYKSTGKVSGMSGDVDLNISYLAY